MDWTQVRRSSRLTGLVAALVGTSVIACPAAGLQREQITGRRVAGAALVGGSLFMVKQGLDFRADADDYYAQYKRATEPTEIDHWYQLTNNRDVKSQVSWALSAAFAVAGVRLLLSPGPEAPPSRVAARPCPPLPAGLELTLSADTQTVGVGVKRRFF